MGLYLPGSFVRRQEWQEQSRRQKTARELKKRLTAAIQGVYPEHLFTVEVDKDTGNILIDHPLMKDSKARYFVPFYVDDVETATVKLCGEILERVNVKRGELIHFEEYDEAEGLAKTAFSSR